MSQMKKISKFKKALNDQKIPYLIAETAYIHEGDINYLYSILDDLSKYGCCDAVKYHILIDVDSYITPSHDLYNLYKNFKLSVDDWTALLKKTKSKKFETIVLADELKAIDFVEERIHLVDAIELHAIAINNIEMLEKVKHLSIPIILGIGGSNIEEINFAIRYLDRSDILLFYGFQIYPTKYEYINLNRINKLKDIFKLPVGYADHTRWNSKYNELITLSGFVKGANFIEKHIALKAGAKKVDFESAISVELLCNIKGKMDLLNKVLGKDSFEISSYENIVAKNGPMKFTIVASRNLRRGQTITKRDVTFKRTDLENTIEQRDYLKLIGKKLKVDVPQLGLINWEKVEG